MWQNNVSPNADTTFTLHGYEKKNGEKAAGGKGRKILGLSQNGYVERTRLLVEAEGIRHHAQIPPAKYIAKIILGVFGQDTFFACPRSQSVSCTTFRRL